MKKILLMATVLYSGSSMAQAKLVTQAVVNTTTTIVAPEDEDVSNIQGQGEGRMNFRNFADGETKSVTYLKNDLVKTVMKSDMGRSTTIRDNGKKITTTLMEMMGNKTGFYATDEDQANMRKRMDSMMQARRTTTAASGDTTVQRVARTGDMPVDIVYTEETKKIAGYNCKKAYVVTTRFMGIKDSSVIWYTPEIKLQNISSTGGFSGFGSFGMTPSTNAFSKIDGFVMQQESRMGRGRKMTIEVTKIEINKEIADKEFDIPKDFDVKPMADMQNMMQRGPGGENRTIIRTN